MGRTHAHIVELRYTSRAKPPKSSNLTGVRLQKLELDMGIPTTPLFGVGNTTALGPKINCVFGYVRYFDVYRREQRSRFRYDRDGLPRTSRGGDAWNRTD